MRYKKSKIPLVLLVLSLSFSSQGQDQLILSREDCETKFLKENLQLLAEELEISQAEAMVLQSKYWPNPNLTIDQVNLWATQGQLDAFDTEGLPAFNSGSSFGTKQQIGVSLEQLIHTAGKRKKLMAIQNISLEKSKEYFRDVLRGLKIEFRNQLTQLQYLQLSKSMYEEELLSVKQLTNAYLRQVELGHISKGEYVRLKALELEITQKTNAVKTEINQVQKELNVLMRLSANTDLVITDAGFIKDTDGFKLRSIPDLIVEAKENRPDYKIASLQETSSLIELEYEKAQRIPDVTFKVDYDRGGNFMYNFVGFGLSFDLPVFDRNKGNILHATSEIEQSELRSQELELTLENEVAAAYKDLINAIAFFESIDADYDVSLEIMLKNYTQNFKEKNISIVEYLDFMEAYLTNKIIILEASKDVNEKAEKLNYSIGKDLINK